MAAPPAPSWSVRRDLSREATSKVFRDLGFVTHLREEGEDGMHDADTAHYGGRAECFVVLEGGPSAAAPDVRTPWTELEVNSGSIEHAVYLAKPPEKCLISFKRAVRDDYVPEGARSIRLRFVGEQLRWAWINADGEFIQPKGTQIRVAYLETCL